MDFLAQHLTSCHLCPRECGINRLQGEIGFCGAGLLPKVARVALHHWEEPPISGTQGSGTVFFSDCNLGCCYCQNYQISLEHFGKELTISELSENFLALEAQGAHNLNLVTVTPYLPQVIMALELARNQGLQLPVVYNSSGYEKLATLELISGLVQIYLPDLKYLSPSLSKKYSQAADYFAIASVALREMFRQVGKVTLNSAGIITRGMMVRHLILPGHIGETINCLNWLKKNLPDGAYLSLMAQYTPQAALQLPPPLNRKLTLGEYEQVLEKLFELELEDGFLQELESASNDYRPDFTTGV